MKPGGAGFWTRIAFLFLAWSGRAMAALSVMVVTAVAALIFLSALAVGVKDAMLRNIVGLYSGHVTGYDRPESIRAEDLDVEGGTIMDIFRQGFSESFRFESWERQMPDLRQLIDPGVVSVRQPGYGYRAADRSAHARPGK